MLCTRFNFFLEKWFVEEFLEKIAIRLTQKNPKKDAVLLCEGSEGEGKSTYSIAIAYWMAEKTNRSFSAANVFFKLEDLMKYAKETEQQIFIWDEPSLQALSGDGGKKIVKDLTRLLMMARKKRHFMIINMTKFSKFNEYLVADRPIGMIHVYSKEEVDSGYFVYYKRKGLMGLWEDWIKRRQKAYKKWYWKKGRFPDVLNPDYKGNVLSEFDVASYERRKDEAINSIGEDSTVKNPWRLETIRIKARIGKLKCPIKTQAELCQKLGIGERTIREWGQKYKIDDNDVIEVENEAKPLGN